MREDMPYRLTNENDIASPALIYYPDIIRENTRLAVDMAGGAARLWPHVKSHKMAELIDMQMDMGVTRFKCATISEMALTCSRGAAHVLLAGAEHKPLSRHGGEIPGDHVLGAGRLPRGADGARQRVRGARRGCQLAVRRESGHGSNRRAAS